MASKFSLSAIFKAIDEMTAPIQKMTRSTNTFSKQLKTDFAKAQRSVDNFGRNFSNVMRTGVMIGTGLAIYGITNLAKSGMQLASDLVEVQNVVDTTFTKNSKVIDAWSKTAITQFGLSELQAKKFNGTMGALLKSSGITGNAIVEMSTDLTGLAGDFASFYNLDHQQAFDKIRSGISGETEPLKSLGINMSVANLEAFALSQGITKAWKAMTQSEQVMLRYNYIMKASKDAQGDFNKTLSTSVANQQRVFKNNIDSLSASIMSKLLPMLLEGLKKINAFVQSLDGEKVGNMVVKIVNSIMFFGKVVIDVIKFLTPFAPLILSIVAAIALYKAMLIIAAIAQWAMNVAMTANPVGIIIVAIGILIGLIVLLVMHWKEVTAWLVDSYEKFKVWIAIFAPGLVLVVEIIKAVVKNWDAIVTGIQSAINWFKNLGISILNFFIEPLKLALTLLSKIPGMEGIGLDALKAVETVQMKINGTPEKTINPMERAMVNKEEKTSKASLLIKDETGKAKMENKVDKNMFNLNLIHTGK